METKVSSAKHRFREALGDAYIYKEIEKGDNAMLHDSETWFLNVGDMQRLVRNKAGMLYWMCDDSLHVSQSIGLLRETLGLRGIDSCIKKC